MYAFGNKKIKVKGKWIHYKGHNFLLVCVVSRLMAQWKEQHDNIHNSHELLNYLRETAEGYLDALVECDEDLKEVVA